MSASTGSTSVKKAVRPAGHAPRVVSAKRPLPTPDDEQAKKPRVETDDDVASSIMRDLIPNDAEEKKEAPPHAAVESVVAAVSAEAAAEANANADASAPVATEVLVVAEVVAPRAVFPDMLHAAAPMARFVVDTVSARACELLHADSVQHMRVCEAKRNACVALLRLLTSAPCTTLQVLAQDAAAALDWREYIFGGFARRVALSWDVLVNVPPPVCPPPAETASATLGVLANVARELRDIWSANADMYHQDASKTHLAVDAILLTFIDALL